VRRSTRAMARAYRRWRTARERVRRAEQLARSAIMTRECAIYNHDRVCGIIHAHLNGCPCALCKHSRRSGTMVPNTHVDGFAAKTRHHHTTIAAAHAALFESRMAYRLSMSERAEAYDQHDRLHAVVMAAANAAEATVVSGDTPFFTRIQEAASNEDHMRSGRPNGRGAPPSGTFPYNTGRTMLPTKQVMEQCNRSWPPCSHPETWVRQQKPTSAMLSVYRAEGFSPVSDSDEEPPGSEGVLQTMDVSGDTSSGVSKDTILLWSDLHSERPRGYLVGSTPGAANLVTGVVAVAMASAVPGADGASISPTVLTLDLLAPWDSLVLGVCVGGIAAAVAIAIISSSTIRTWVSEHKRCVARRHVVGASGIGYGSIHHNRQYQLADVAAGVARARGACCTRCGGRGRTPL
jgi:hypothetical protein